MNEDKEEAFAFCIEEVGVAGNEIIFFYRDNGEVGQMLSSESEARQKAGEYLIVKDRARNQAALVELQDSDSLFDVPLTRFFEVNSRAKVIQLSTYSKISGLVINIRYEVVIEGDDRVLYSSSSLDIATGRAKEQAGSEVGRVNTKIAGVNSQSLKRLKI